MSNLFNVRKHVHKSEVDIVEVTFWVIYGAVTG